MSLSVFLWPCVGSHSNFQTQEPAPRFGWRSKNCTCCLFWQAVRMACVEQYRWLCLHFVRASLPCPWAEGGEKKQACAKPRSRGVQSARLMERQAIAEVSLAISRGIRQNPERNASRPKSPLAGQDFHRASSASQEDPARTDLFRSACCSAAPLPRPAKNDQVRLGPFTPAPGQARN